MRLAAGVPRLSTLFLILLLPCTAAAMEGKGADAPLIARPQESYNAAAVSAQSGRPSLFRYGNYAGLAEMITVVCDEAAKVFDHFYGPSQVMVKPFVFVTETGEKRLTELGATLADQMMAMVNRNTVDGRLKGDGGQDLQGVLQEIDGYLRLHISGTNLQAERRSYTANIEMSEPLFRSLHATYGGR
ncbi:MAG: hypothetical protein AB1568_17330 [Thermodesulfobacteriota bacterium]